jgi:hypothetical protein
VWACWWLAWRCRWSAHALAHYWWVLLALPFLLALLHPRALPALLDRAFAVVGRQPLRSTVRAGMWSALSWLLLGTHFYVLCAALGHTGFSAFALSVGGMALAVSAVCCLFRHRPAQDCVKLCCCWCCGRS